MKSLLIFLTHFKGLFFEYILFYYFQNIQILKFQVLFFDHNKSVCIQRKSHIIHIILLALLAKINLSHPAQVSGAPN